MEALKQIIKAMDKYAAETGKMPGVITISGQVFREITLVNPPPGTKAQINGVDCVVSKLLTGKAFVFGHIQQIEERLPKDTAMYWAGVCLRGNCHTVARSCPYWNKGECKRKLAEDIDFYAKEGNGGK